jgi:hypothetical protein
MEDSELIGECAQIAYARYNDGTPDAEWVKFKDLPTDEQEKWLQVGQGVFKFFRGCTLEPGMKSILFASGDFPDTDIEVVSHRVVYLVTIKLPDGTTHEVDVGALIDWSSDWGLITPDGQHLTTHIDTFSAQRPPHPITGLAWVGGDPDYLKALKLLEP